MERIHITQHSSLGAAWFVGGTSMRMDRGLARMESRDALHRQRTAAT